MKTDILTKKGKELAFLLRHDSTYSFDENGFRKVTNLVNHHGFTEELLEKIVMTDNKGRYEFNDDHTLIRARQGHSIDVDVHLEEKVPPSVLYHGTAIRFLDAILSDGIKKMSRQYVHLSFDIETAMGVGNRHGHPIVIVIDSKKMHEDGIKFYLSNNNVPLVNFVDPKYIIGFGAGYNGNKIINLSFERK